MLYKVSEELKQELLRRPETGPGFQIVKTKDQYGSEIHVYILNATVGISDLDNEDEVKEAMLFLNFHQPGALKIAHHVLQLEYSDITHYLERVDFLHLNLPLTTTIYGDMKRIAGGKAASETYEQKDLSQKLIRISWFLKDERVTINHVGDVIDDKGNKAVQDQTHFLPGTYFTTVEDYEQCVSIGDEPSDRYSFVVPAPAKHVRRLSLNNCNYYKIGISQPISASKKTIWGGGVEVIIAEKVTRVDVISPVKYGTVDL